MIGLGIIIILLLIYVGFDYGRLIVKNRRIEQELDIFDYVPVRNIMIAAPDGDHIVDLSLMCLSAHHKSGVGVKSLIEEKHFTRTLFDNGDEMWLIKYDENMSIDALTKHEKEDYANKIFFDYKLPEGAERVIIKQLGLIDYMVNMGFCQKKGVNNE